MTHLNNLPTLLFTEPRYKSIHSILVSKGQETVFEGYFQGYDSQKLHEAQSVTKSIQSILVGIALEKKFIPSLDTKIKPYFSQYTHLDWSKGKADITIRHLLQMTAGLQWNEAQVPYTAYYQNDANILGLSQDWLHYALNKPMAHKPSLSFAYSSASPILLSHILREATCLPNELFAMHYLYIPLGISTWEYSKSQHDPEILGDIALLPVDMLKIGQLMLGNGTYQGKNIVSKAWVQEASYLHQSLKTAAKGYGYMWWVDNLPLFGHTSPYYYAWGYGGQHIFVVPALQICVVFTGGFYHLTLANEPFELLHEHILPNLAF